MDIRSKAAGVKKCLFDKKMYKQINKPISPQAYMVIDKFKYKETFFCTCRRASMTVEAAVVLPIFAGFLVVMLFLFRMVLVQSSIEEAMVYAGRKTAVEASVIEDDALLLLSATAFLQQGLSEDEAVKRYVKLGNSGVTLLGSYIEDEKIHLRVGYGIKLPISLFGEDTIWCWNRGSFQTWSCVGKSGEEPEKGSVYITDTGAVYHKSLDCQVLKLSIKQISVDEIAALRGKNGQKYYGCSCSAKEENILLVYYTDYGKLYHAKPDCRHLKRSIHCILLSEVGERRKCSYCYGG